MAKKTFARSPEFKGPDMTVSFAQNLFKVRETSGKFEATFIGPNDLKTAKICQVPDGKGGMVKKSLTDIVGDVILAEWGEKGLERARNGLIKSPFLAGDGKEARNNQTGDLHPGMGPGLFFIRTKANADRPPQVSKSPAAFIPASEQDVYSGCVGFPILNVYAWNNAENGDGVSFGINMFFKKADGERLGGGGSSSPDAWTETVEDAGAAPDETKSGAGAGGLFS